MLKIQNLCFSYNQIKILKNISFDLDEGIIIGLIGPNGSGKSTLLKNILALEKPGKGTITYNNKEIGNMSLLERSKTISYVPQFTMPNFSHNVFYTVLMGRRPYIGWDYTELDKLKTWNALKQMNLENLNERLFTTLSGGEKQKTILARAIVQECPIMLLDEPTSNLDLKHKQEFMQTITTISHEKKTSILMVVHDINLASIYCDKLLLLNQGEKVMEGEPRNVITKQNIEEVYGIKVKIVEYETIPYLILD